MAPISVIMFFSEPCWKDLVRFEEKGSIFFQEPSSTAGMPRGRNASYQDTAVELGKELVCANSFAFRSSVIFFRLTEKKGPPFPSIRSTTSAFLGGAGAQTRPHSAVMEV
jgi:hypothetical protein